MLAFLTAVALQWPTFTDDLDKASLLKAVAHQEQDLLKQPKQALVMADRKVTTADLLRSLRLFRQVVQQHHGKPSFDLELRRRFQLVDVGGAYVTGYYLPLLDASWRREGAYVYPLYRFPGADRRYSRQQIEAGALAGRGLELAWVKDPIARYSLMVQGSGLLRFADGQMRHVNYAGSNGFAYQSLGKIFLAEGKLTDETLSWQAIRDYFLANPHERETYFNRNASYSFFKLSDGGPYGLSRIPLTPGRSIATDKRHFPAGGLGYISIPSQGISRFVLDQDTGGAILGRHRVDLYLGGGEAAADLAGRLKHDGQLYFLLAK